MKQPFFLKKIIKSTFTIVLVTIFVFTPLIISFTPDKNGIFIPKIEKQQALALINVGVLDNQQLNVSYQSGNLIMTITGTKSNVGLFNTIKFVYQLPEELSDLFVVEGTQFPNFPQGARIDYNIDTGPNGTISRGSLGLDSASRTVTGSVYLGLLDLYVNKAVTATLTIPLAALPSVPDSTLSFKAVAESGDVISLQVLGSYGSIEDIVLPPAPTINPVTDLDTVVTGTGTAGKIVQIITPGHIYEGYVNANGTYSIPIPVQAAGTRITAAQITAEGFKGPETPITVEGTLTFFVPSVIEFTKTTIHFQDVTIPRTLTNWSITVRDTRGQSSQWHITAHATGPLTSTDGHTLNPDALVYVNGSNVYSLIGEVPIFSWTTGLEPQKTVNWSENEGVLIKMNASDFLNIDPVEYTTTITWTLTDGP